MGPGLSPPATAWPYRRCPIVAPQGHGQTSKQPNFQASKLPSLQTSTSFHVEAAFEGEGAFAAELDAAGVVAGGDGAVGVGGGEAEKGDGHVEVGAGILGVGLEGALEDAHGLLGAVFGEIGAGGDELPVEAKGAAARDEGHELERVVGAALEEAKAGEAVEAMGLTHLVSQLEQDTDALEEAIRQRNREDAAFAKQYGTLTATAQRKEVDELYQQIVTRVNAYNVVEPSEDIEAFILDATATANHFANVAAQGGTSKPNLDPGPGTSTGSDEEEEEEERPGGL